MQVLFQATLSFSSEDEEYMVQPEDIPDLKERAKQADVLETFMGTGEDEKEFSTEMLIYEKEAVSVIFIPVIYLSIYLLYQHFKVKKIIQFNEEN